MILIINKWGVYTSMVTPTYHIRRLNQLFCAHDPSQPIACASAVISCTKRWDRINFTHLNQHAIELMLIIIIILTDRDTAKTSL